jgi:hypothetical protein
LAAIEWLAAAPAEGTGRSPWERGPFQSANRFLIFINTVIINKFIYTSVLQKYKFIFLNSQPAWQKSHSALLLTFGGRAAERSLRPRIPG